MNKLTNILISVTLNIIFLIYGKKLLIPFILAIFTWFIIREVRMFLRRNKFIREKVPTWIENVLSSLILFGALNLLIGILVNNINYLSHNLPIYEENISKIGLIIHEKFNIDIMEKIENFTIGLNFTDIISIIINSISSLIGNILVILIYVLFLLIEESGFDKKFDLLFDDSTQLKNGRKVLNKISHSIGHYISLKTLVSFITGLLSFIGLKLLGVEAALFWAFIIFALNYIPNIGSPIATLFPAIFVVLQTGELMPGVWVLIIIGAIQLIIGNIVEPKVMGDSLNLSSLAVILALTIWGILWGVVGMILSVPITVILLILFSEFDSTKKIAILLSEKGDID